eukprot:gene16909-8091_t
MVGGSGGAAAKARAKVALHTGTAGGEVREKVALPTGTAGGEVREKVTLPTGTAGAEVCEKLGRGGRAGFIDKYDLVAGGGWIDTADRRKLGVAFTTSVNDQGIVFAVKKPRVIQSDMWDYA